MTTRELHVPERDRCTSGSTETREVGVERTADAFWLREPGAGEIRTVRLPARGPGEVQVRTTRSAISRGTEALVFRGRVPPDQYSVMRAPFQEGEFPGPVKYGYLSVGVVEEGPPALVGCTVFCLHPHQTAYVVPAAAVTLIPPDVPERRAGLTRLVETAGNALWDAGPLLGGRGRVARLRSVQYAPGDEPREEESAECDRRDSDAGVEHGDVPPGG